MLWEKTHLSICESSTPFRELLTPRKPEIHTPDRRRDQHTPHAYHKHTRTAHVQTYTHATCTLIPRATHTVLKVRVNLHMMGTGDEAPTAHTRVHPVVAARNWQYQN